MKKALVVFKRDFYQNIRRPMFWLSLLVVPVVLCISFAGAFPYSDFKENQQEQKDLIIVDDSAFIRNEVLSAVQRKVGNLDLALQEVRDNKSQMPILYYPKNLDKQNSIQIYTSKDSNELRQVASELLRKSIALEITDPVKKGLLEMPPKVEIKPLSEEQKDSDTVAKLKFQSIIIAVIYFMFIVTSMGSILTSFSEEKENRVMEIIISLVKPRDFVLGKLLAQLLLLVLQTLFMTSIMALFIGVFYFIYLGSLPIAEGIKILSTSVDFYLIPKILFYLVCGFLFNANVAIGLSAAMPSIKESGKFLGIFIILNTLPLNFVNILIDNHGSAIITFLTYFPFTSALVLLIRDMAGQFSTPMQIVNSMVLIGYVILSFIVSFRLFKMGFFEYNKKISLKRIFS